MLFLKLAWRNIWRNKRRTLITMASVVMAVLLASVMSSMQEGSYDQMIDNTVGSSTGHIQIQAQGYHDEPTLDNSFEIDSTLLEEVAEQLGVASVIPRIDSYALSAGEERSRAAMVIGIDIEAEKSLSEPHEKIVEGTYLENNNQQSALVAAGLADYLDVTIGDTLILLGQGFRGTNASGAYPIGGIIEFGIPDMNNSLVYLPLQTASRFYGTYDRLTALVLLAERPEDVQAITRSLRSQLPEQYAVLDWQTLMPELVQAIQADSGSNFIIQLILYMVVGFGIFGTVLMMTAERKFELGVMIATGTSRISVATILLLEMIFITFMGTLVGMIASVPFMYYFNRNPIYFSGDAAAAIKEWGMEPFVQFSTDPSIFLTQGAIVLSITLLICIYPLWYAFKLQPVSAMRQ
ncbi:ABC transporter permease [Aliifodinibius salicampi]|uniref:ABC transporter permease n=1 Tax=Fodinibius salicampi TaxID=1920655 RepID=A0ABT3Q1K3_9BACT|nr:ABC transporter permease [Fodinibius salicampi]MCW9713983.1 ABC transporter permease [Fodinibius salicampi]